ncbi:MAG: metallophosphoesterase [Clostridium sp.]|jgi:predicted phosphohydrolase|nr:metallophosphoesterase [Clostridium sp.]
MKVFAIGDLHLSGSSNKPMDVFGPTWADHPQRVISAWRSAVGENDIVLIPGDISWAMRLEDAICDLEFIGALPGTKLLLRGNHDYWWSALGKVRAALPNGCFALQNDCFTIDNISVCGSRGWVCPGSSAYSETKDRAIYERELIRLRMSLNRLPEGTVRILMLHFPPFNEKRQDSGFTQLAEEYGINYLIYAHLHNKACLGAFEGERNGIQYSLCSADHLGFAPRLILDAKEPAKKNSCD